MENQYCAMRVFFVFFRSTLVLQERNKQKQKEKKKTNGTYKENAIQQFEIEKILSKHPDLPFWLPEEVSALFCNLKEFLFACLLKVQDLQHYKTVSAYHATIIFLTTYFRDLFETLIKKGEPTLV